MISNLEKAFENFEFLAEQKGIEKGIEKGMEKGILRVAETMLAKGTDISYIAEVTGLTEDEIKKLRRPQ